VIWWVGDLVIWATELADCVVVDLAAETGLRQIGKS